MQEITKITTQTNEVKIAQLAVGEEALIISPAGKVVGKGRYPATVKIPASYTLHVGKVAEIVAKAAEVAALADKPA